MDKPYRPQMSHYLKPSNQRLNIGCRTVELKEWVRYPGWLHNSVKDLELALVARLAKIVN